MIILHTNKGDIKIELDFDKAPVTEKYTIAMARTSDPHSASAQFFINTADNAFLNFRSKELYGKTVVQDWGYAVFGKVVDGFDVVDAIEGVATKRHGYHDDVPTEPVVITKAEAV